MKYIHLHLFLCLFWTYCNGQSGAPLLKIEENNRYGFIDPSGKIVIKPVFRDAGEYSENLIAARIDGLYGYINRNGEWIIKPQFELATDFKEGFAVVYIDESFWFIDHKGERKFNTWYAKHLEPFDGGFSIFKTKNGRCGVMNIKGQLSIDTAYIHIEKIGNGLFKAHPIKYTKQWSNFFQVIDTLGNIVIPVNTYNQLGKFKNGYAKVKKLISPNLPHDSCTIEGFIDTKGSLIIQVVTSDYNSLLSEEINNDIGIVKLFRAPQELRFNRLYHGNLYPGYFDKYGKVVFNEKDTRVLSPFNNNRAFVNNYLIDRNFKRVSEVEYRSVLSGFQNGYAFVSINQDYSLIDTTGRVIHKDLFNSILNNKIIDDYFFFTSFKFPKSNGRLFGIADVKGNILVEPIFERVDNNGFIHGLLSVVIDGNQCLVDKTGKVVWKKKKQSSLDEYSINHMMRGYFYAYSKPDTNSTGGYGGSNNRPKSEKPEYHFPKNQLYLHIMDNLIDTFGRNWKGYKVILANTTSNNLKFDAEDSRLSIVTEAKDKDGNWKRIDYVSHSWCGNSYHQLVLEPKTFWEFKMPEFGGAFETTLRLRFSYFDPNIPLEDDDENTVTIYSNEIKCRINRTQFWRKESYYPHSIMDPYLD